MSTAAITQRALGSAEAPTVATAPLVMSPAVTTSVGTTGVVTPVAERDHRSLVGVLFAVHRRVAVRLDDGTGGPVFCTCGDLWPCRSEELAASVLDFPL